MFHMTQEMYYKAQELGRLAAQSDEFLAMKEAEKAAESEPQLARCVAAFVEARQKLEDETRKDEKDFDKIGELTRELDEIQERMQEIDAYRTLQQAKKDFEAMMEAVTEIIQSALSPQQGCCGDCSQCGGCSGAEKPE